MKPPTHPDYIVRPQPTPVLKFARKHQTKGRLLPDALGYVELPVPKVYPSLWVDPEPTTEATEESLTVNVRRSIAQLRVWRQRRDEGRNSRLVENWPQGAA